MMAFLILFCLLDLLSVSYVGGSMTTSDDNFPFFLLIVGLVLCRNPWGFFLFLNQNWGLAAFS